MVFVKYNHSDEIKEDDIGRVCSMHREKMNAHRILVETPEGKKEILEYFKNFSISYFIY
jgi:hypothetical protein